MPKRLRVVVVVGAVVAVVVVPLFLEVVAVGLTGSVVVEDLREKRFLSSSVEKAAPVLRMGDECVDDSADVLLSELDRTEMRPIREFLPLPLSLSSSRAIELLEDVRE